MLKNKGPYYPLGDTLSPADYATLKLKSFADVRRVEQAGEVFYAKNTGVLRNPRAGEWYLSGAVVYAYRAPNDLPGESFYIATLVRVRSVTVQVEVVP